MTGEGNTGTRMIGGQLVGSQMVGNQMVGNPIVGPSMVGPPLGAPLGQLNIVQRMSMIIKSQLPVLQATMIIVETKRL